MELITLVENRSIDASLGAEHGLSLLIRLNGRSILFDTGKSELFQRNAAALGISLGDIDLAILSHGHYDHGGGLRAFLEANGHAPVYIRKTAFETHLSKRPNAELANIGLDTALMDSGRLVYTDELGPIDRELTLFSNVTERELFSGCNASILMRRGEQVLADDFTHEQNLIIEDGGKAVLIAGCAHCGIVNILRRAEKILGKMPDVVVGGFHLHSPSAGRSEPEERVRAIGEILCRSGAAFYTGHCTGEAAFSILKAQLGDRLHELHAGTMINF